jgi:hypothetical protein
MIELFKRFISVIYMNNKNCADLLAILLVLFIVCSITSGLQTKQQFATFVDLSGRPPKTLSVIRISVSIQLFLHAKANINQMCGI